MTPYIDFFLDNVIGDHPRHSHLYRRGTGERGSENVATNAESRGVFVGAKKVLLRIGLIYRLSTRKAKG